MKQVLLAPQSNGHTRPSTVPPITMWMPDDTSPGDTFLFKKKAWVVSAIYSTSFPSSLSTECRRTERPHRHTQACVVLDHHGDPTHPGN